MAHIRRFSLGIVPSLQLSTINNTSPRGGVPSPRAKDNVKKLPGDTRKKTPRQPALFCNDIITEIDHIQIVNIIGTKPSYPVLLDFSGDRFALESLQFLEFCPSNVIKTLDLGNNKLRTVKIDGYEKLKRLSLTNNLIRKFKLSNAPSLLVLTLSNNRLIHVPDFSGSPKLVNVDLSINCIKDNWHELKNLTNCKVLDVSSNQLEMSISEFYNYILVPLKSLSKLQYLSLSDNPVVNIIPHIKYFVISELPQLKHYDWEAITKEDRILANRYRTQDVWKDKSAPCIGKFKHVNPVNDFQDAEESKETTLNFNEYEDSWEAAFQGGLNNTNSSPLQFGNSKLKLERRKSDISEQREVQRKASVSLGSVSLANLHSIDPLDEIINDYEQKNSF